MCAHAAHMPVVGAQRKHKQQQRTTPIAPFALHKRVHARDWWQLYGIIYENVKYEKL